MNRTSSKKYLNFIPIMKATLFNVNGVSKKIQLCLITLLFLLSSSKSFTQELIVIESDYLKCNDSVLVFTPTTVTENTPALFLLHGWSGNYSNWSKKTDIQKVSDKYGFIIITPDGFYNSWYLNNVDPQKMQWRAFFNKELYPLMKEKYNLNPERTFITGLSMGGHGAINIYLDDTTRFKAAGSMSGVLNLQETGLKKTQINEVLGTFSPENSLYDSSSAINRLESIKGSKKMMVISCGAQDGLVKSAKDFSERCNQLAIANTLIISPGNHTWDYWIFTLDLHLFLFQKYLAK